MTDRTDAVALVSAWREDDEELRVPSSLWGMEFVAAIDVLLETPLLESFLWDGTMDGAMALLKWAEERGVKVGLYDGSWDDERKSWRFASIRGSLRAVMPGGALAIIAGAPVAIDPERAAEVAAPTMLARVREYAKLCVLEDPESLDDYAPSDASRLGAHEVGAAILAILDGEER